MSEWSQLRNIAEDCRDLRDLAKSFARSWMARSRWVRWVWIGRSQVTDPARPTWCCATSTPSRAYWAYRGQCLSMSLPA